MSEHAPIWKQRWLWAGIGITLVAVGEIRLWALLLTSTVVDKDGPRMANYDEAALMLCALNFFAFVLFGFATLVFWIVRSLERRMQRGLAPGSAE